MQARGSRREVRQIVEFCKKIQMNQKEPFNGAVKDNQLNSLVSFDCRDDLVHLRKHLRTEDVERRVIERDSPILGRALGQTYLSPLCSCVTLILHVCCLRVCSVLRLVLCSDRLIGQLWSSVLDEVVLHKETRVINSRGA